MIRKSMHSMSLHSKLLKCKCRSLHFSGASSSVIKIGLAYDKSRDWVEVNVDHSRHSGATACALHTRVTPKSHAPGNYGPPHSANSSPQ